MVWFYVKGYPLEVVVPGGLPVSGIVLVDRVKSLDWQARVVDFICALPSATASKILQRIGVLLLE